MGRNAGRIRGAEIRPRGFGRGNPHLGERASRQDAAPGFGRDPRDAAAESDWKSVEARATRRVQRDPGDTGDIGDTGRKNSVLACVTCVTYVTASSCRSVRIAR